MKVQFTYMGAVSLFRIALNQAPQWGKKAINGVKIDYE